MAHKPNGQFNKNVAELTRLAAAQIRVAVTESTDSVDTLSTSFTEIVSQDKMIRQKIELLSDDAETLQIKQEIAAISSELRENIDKAVIAFQFYDRLCQRLDHTSECLRKLSEIKEQEVDSKAEEVLRLRDNVYNHFTMLEERQLFDAVISSQNFEQAIADYTVARQNSLESESESDHDIELF
ncbi:MAG: hypothetical protein COA74_01875 [Gammaproteobacteria bacterium]|nr:MAG: hypothetical protein COA74_01875 [Gammaproteobacteria bacterium]